MASPQTLFGTGLVLSETHILTVVEYALVVTRVGQDQQLVGSLLVLEGSRDLGSLDQLHLRLEDGSSSDIIAAVGDATTGKYSVTAILRRDSGAE